MGAKPSGTSGSAFLEHALQPALVLQCVSAWSLLWLSMVLTHTGPEAFRISCVCPSWHEPSAASLSHTMHERWGSHDPQFPLPPMALTWNL